jgi:WD40 repeat protein
MGTPKRIEDVLVEEGRVICSIAFDRTGNRLAAGCDDKHVVLFDMETRGVERVIDMETTDETVTRSLAWSDDGERLLAGTSHEVRVYDLVKDKIVASYTHKTEGEEFANHITNAVLHPSERAFLVNFRTGLPQLHKIDDGGASAAIAIPTTLAETGEERQGEKSNNNKSPFPIVAHFIQSGSRVVVGNARGEIEMLKTREISSSSPSSQEPAAATTTSTTRTKIKGSSSVLGFSEDSQGSLLAVNCMASRSGFLHILRKKEQVQNDNDNHYEVNMTDAANASAKKTTEAAAESDYNHVFDFHQPTHEDTPMGWCCFSWDGTYLVGSGGKKNKHQIYLWNVLEKTLETVLEGPDVSLWHLAWRPYRANLLSLADGGKILIWSKDYVENWSSFAPGFRELQHNEEYREAEDEFDIGVSSSSKSCQISSNEEYSQDAINIMC